MRNRPPQLGLPGVRIDRGDVPPRSIVPPGSMRRRERPIAEQFTGIRVLRTGFRAITLNAPSIAAGSSAWFGLGSWRFPDDTGQQMYLVGYRVELGPTNPAGLGTPGFDDISNVSWGAVDGSGAAVVVGRNLPCQVNTWSSGPSGIPFVETNAGILPGGPSEDLVFHFATGNVSVSSTSAVGTTYRASFSTPLSMILGQSSRLDVALVVSRLGVNNKTGDLVGRCYVELYLAPTLISGEIVD